MKSVRTMIALSVALFAAVSLAGCEGGGSSTSNSLRPYIGVWTGTFVNTPAGSAVPQNGTAEITVANNGTVTGTLENTTTGDTGALSAVLTLDDDEVIVNGTIAYTGAAVFQAAGTLSIQPNNHLTGTVYTYDAQRQLQSSTVVDLARP